MFDIYEDTCLHPGIIADGVAGKLVNEAQYEALSSKLEERALEKYRDDPEFRAKLSATHHKSTASEQEARNARQGLEDTMTQWANEIISQASL